MVQIVDAGVRRRRKRAGGKTEVAALFRLWHDARTLIELAEGLGESELVHLLSVTQLLVEERTASLDAAVAAFDEGDPARPN